MKLCNPSSIQSDAGSAMTKVLIVDDVEESRWVLSNIVRQSGFLPIMADSGARALVLTEQEEPDAILLDVGLPDMNGFDVLQQIQKKHNSLPVIMVTGNGNIEDAKHALRANAFDYVAKPFLNSDMIQLLTRALRQRISRPWNPSQDVPMKECSELLKSMGCSIYVQKIIREKTKVSATSFAVLVIGETGTGKELVSRAIHEESGRATKPFIAVDCGAIPEALIESELFGHEKGAFTGATGLKIGAFEAAAGGTIFLDEIANLPYSVQGKILRVLETRSIRRIGSIQEKPIDFRVVAATNIDLKNADPKSFRVDLYHRLAEFTIQIPPLRERREDLVYLVNRFLERTNLELSKRVVGLSQDSWDLVHAYQWPGNVRELRNEIRRAVLLYPDNEAIDCSLLSNLMVPLNPPTRKPEINASETIIHQAEHFETEPAMKLSDSQSGFEFSCQLSTQDIESLISMDGGLCLTKVIGQAMSQMERGILIQVLKFADGNKAKAARLLHIDYKTIHSKLKKHQINSLFQFLEPQCP